MNKYTCALSVSLIRLGSLLRWTFSGLEVLRGRDLIKENAETAGGDI